MKTIKISRRDFVGKALAGGALLVAYPWLGVLAENSFSDYSQKVRVGVIGVGSRGLLLLHYLTELSEKINIEVIAVCDNYEPHYQRAIERTEGKAKAFYDGARNMNSQLGDDNFKINESETLQTQKIGDEKRNFHTLFVFNFPLHFYISC